MMFRALPILLLLASRAIADGFSPMPLRDVRLDGKAHWLFDHHWAANANDAGAEHTARLYCSLNDRSDAEAVGKFLGITIVGQGAKKVEDQKKE